MDGNADSDHSMTWEDFFGNTIDLTPTLIGIYDSLLEPEKSLRPEESRLETAKDARNDPPVSKCQENMLEQKDNFVFASPPKDPSKIAGSIKLPIATLNKSSLYTIRTKSDNNGAIEPKSDLTTNLLNTVTRDKLQKSANVKNEAFENLSPNVKRMISSASETTTLKFQKKTLNVGRSSTRRCNIPLMGATSKITQSGLAILPSVDTLVYDQPSAIMKIDLPAKLTKPDFKIDAEQTTYDVPTNNMPAIYDVPNANKTVFESLSLPYIDQSIELSLSSNDREFDTKLQSKDNSPQKPEPVTPTPEVSPENFPKTSSRSNSLHRKEFGSQNSPNKLLKSTPYPDAVASTGNLKIGQDKEITRLNPAIEVTRPLSMSSIASSSSTSSSGVQNKGGVNSAYLASIESLDDHSDVDIPVLKTSASEESRNELSRQKTYEEMPGLSQLERVCAEIVQTENVYVEDLRQVVEGYLHVWKRERIFSDDELMELFNNIEDIYAFNRSLCSELNTCQLDATCIARCFVNNTTGFSVYTSYCTGYPRTMERLAALASRPQSAREFRERQMDLRHPLPLASYLLKPVQRILKYHLLLQNVVKQCASSETEYALSQMTGIAQHIDDMKRRHEHAVRVQEIQSLLYGWSGPDLTTYGELCAEGTFRVFGAKAMRHAFLFDKMLLVTKNREDGILAYKSHIMCNNMMLVESIAGAPLSFHVIPWDAPRAQLTLQARSPRHKREWTLLLKRVILENYNAVIPSHARQLVMELGQNKTDDDILAEKSHNLITQASMRKQLSAPEYLEKRKLERERRKSFESNVRGRSKKSNRKYTAPNPSESRDCDCSQTSNEKGLDYTCDNCYTDLCLDCEVELAKKKKENKCNCANDKSLEEKCSECYEPLQYIDAGSPERGTTRQSDCKCSDFNSSQESFTKDFTNSLHKTRGYHSSDNIVDYIDSKDLTEGKKSLTNIGHNRKTCLKCYKIKENIAMTDSTLPRKSRCTNSEKSRIEILRSKSKDDPQRSKLSKIGTWRRKSEPGLQQNAIVIKKPQDSCVDKSDCRGSEKIEFECRNCGSNKINKTKKVNDGTVISDPEVDSKGRITNSKTNLDIKMYNTKNIPKKISKIKKNRAKGLRINDTSTRFYTDFSTDMSTENILHISESNDSLNVDEIKPELLRPTLPAKLSKDEDIDEETYRKLVEKTDSFKKNELEKVKFLNKQKVINEGSETDDKHSTDQINEDNQESYEEIEQPLEQIISQLLMQNREFQKLLKKQQQRNSAHRRHQRLLKSYSTPEQVMLSINDTSQCKPKYNRQWSENVAEPKPLYDQNFISNNETEDGSDNDHIYETLRVENKVDASIVNSINRDNSIEKSIDTPIAFSSPLNVKDNKTSSSNGCDADYVYLTFNDLKRQESLDDGIYDVPIKSPEKVKALEQVATTPDYYVSMTNKVTMTEGLDENLYDSLIEVCRRKKEVPVSLPSDYLPMSPDQQSPNTPEIWLSRQKEHFNVSRDRKSGSLPRSFQVVTNAQDENNLSTFKTKTNTNGKTYLNRDGKVVSADRPFTIASDQSEISYDDVETYMSGGDVLKFNKHSKAKREENENDITQSTLELEEEIDRCYKNNFERVNLDANKNENILTTQTSVNVSSTSSCEALMLDSNMDEASNVEIVHPEHKIYKPTGNVLSLKNVLSRFKSRTPPKNTEEIEVGAPEQKIDLPKGDMKSPTNEKRSALNPRSYSKNLLQRFRSIIGDEQPDDIQNKPECPKISKDTVDKNIKNEIKIIVTAGDNSAINTCSTTNNTNTLSRSVHEQRTSSENQVEKNSLEAMSRSFDNLNTKHASQPSYEKSVSMVTNIPKSKGSSSPIKSKNICNQSLNKSPSYLPGSKLLGARLAQPDYVDPMTLINEKSALKNVSILINKNSVRPDSLLSNSSFVTSSSESTYNECNKIQIVSTTFNENTILTKSDCDESYYEKSFERIEQVIDDDVFRDSAVYSDQEDVDDVNKTENPTTKQRVQQNNKILAKVEKVKKDTENTTHVNVTSHLTKTVKIENDRKCITSKIAPPIPIKPKLANIPIVQTVTLTNGKVKTLLTESTSHTFKNDVSMRPSFGRSKSSPLSKDKEKFTNTVNTTEVIENINRTLDVIQGNIQIKRLSFERSSLDSSTRKTRPVTETKRASIEPKTAKSVLERRLEIEKLSKTQLGKAINSKKPVQLTRPKSITTKVASFEKNVCDIDSRDINLATSSAVKTTLPINTQNSLSPNESDGKESWVKQVVNKFQ